MKVDTMRAIDYWVGVPLCLLLSAVDAILRAVRMAPRRVPKRILFIELSEMGSAILADPAMRRARQRFGADIFFAIFAVNRPSLNLLRTVPEPNVFVFRSEGFWMLVADMARFVVWSRRLPIDTVVDLELFSRVSALLARLSGADNRVGFHAFYNEGLYRGSLMTRRVAYNPHMHIAKNFVALVMALEADDIQIPFTKMPVADEDVRIAAVVPAPEDLARARALLLGACPAYRPGETRLVLLNTHGSALLPLRRWPAERYVELARVILDGFADAVAVLIGAPDEREECERLARQVARDRCVSLAGKFQLEQLPTLYSLARVMVSNDSGPVHFAAATDMPVVALYGPETPVLYGPLGRGIALSAGLACSPCVSAANHRRTACTDNVCMKAIPVARVFDSVARIMREDPNRARMP